MMGMALSGELSFKWTGLDALQIMETVSSLLRLAFNTIIVSMNIYHVL